MRHAVRSSSVISTILVLSVSSCVPGRWSPVQTCRPDLGYSFDAGCESWQISPYSEEPGCALFLYPGTDSTLVRFAVRGEGRRGGPDWILLDEISVPLEGDSTFVGGALCPCYRGRNLDCELFALLRRPQCGSKAPLRLWRASRHSKRIEAIDPRGVHCECRCI